MLMLSYLWRKSDFPAPSRPEMLGKSEVSKEKLGKYQESMESLENTRISMCVGFETSSC